MVFSIAERFSIIKDPKQQSKIDHELLDVIFLCVVGMICGAEAWDDIVMFGDARLDWFQNKGFLLNDFKGVAHDYFEEISKGHGRIETRKSWISKGSVKGRRYKCALDSGYAKKVLYGLF